MSAKTQEDGICLPGEEVWELWKSGSKGWVKSQTAPKENNAPAAFKTASLFGFPVSAAFAVPLRAATTDAALFDDLVDVQLEKQGLQNKNTVGQLFDYRVVDREPAATLLLASTLNPQLADRLPVVAPGQFEVSPYLYDLPDNGLVIWKELGRLVFCVTHGDQPIYYHALSGSILTAEVVQEIEHLLMPLLNQGLLGQLEGIYLWTSAFDSAGPPALAESLGLHVRQGTLPAPCPPPQASRLEPVSVAEGKIRAARMARVRNIITLCTFAWLAIPCFFAFRYYMAKESVTKLQNEVASLQNRYGHVQQTVNAWDTMKRALNRDIYPMEVLFQIISPLYAGKPEVRVVSAEIEHATGEQGELTTVTIKGEANTTQHAISYKNRLIQNPALKELQFDGKPENQKDNKVPFRFVGTTKKAEENGVTQ